MPCRGGGPAYFPVSSRPVGRTIAAEREQEATGWQCCTAVETSQPRCPWTRKTERAGIRCSKHTGLDNCLQRSDACCRIWVPRLGILINLERDVVSIPFDTKPTDWTSSEVWTGRRLKTLTFQRIQASGFETKANAVCTHSSSKDKQSDDDFASGRSTCTQGGGVKRCGTQGAEVRCRSALVWKA